ncbi:MAG TPA: tetratricopeptide repeat protein [Steroidobacteraceae bacterium]|nr:tetratricopeptide repeat protein [Steroidobacteraceae bacterium]
MPSYSVRDVERVLQLSPAVTRSLIRAGFVNPERGPRREFRFSFQDLIVLRTARALMQAKISVKRIRRSLESLRRELPDTLPLSGIAISALGDRVVVRDGDARWQVENGQYVLGLDVTLQNGVLHMVEHREEAARPEAAPQDWFSQGLALESSDTDAALEAYRQAAAAEPGNAAAWTNWGRLLHESGRTQEAADVYQRGRQSAGRDSLLLFNHGVLLEDLGDASAALQAYQGALEEDPEFADCHYNLARLYESMGKPQHAIRHLGQYRRLVSNETR